MNPILFQKHEIPLSRPTRDWRILMFIFVLLLAGVILAGAFLFRNVSGTVSTGVDMRASDIPTAAYVETVFSKRKEEELRYRQVYEFVDPSVSGS